MIARPKHLLVLSLLTTIVACKSKGGSSDSESIDTTFKDAVTSQAQKENTSETTDNKTTETAAPIANQTPVVAVPDKPSLTSADGLNSIALSWPTVSSATSYKIFRTTSSGSYSGGPLAETAQTSYSDTAVSFGTNYYYKIVAANAGGDSAASDEKNATPGALPLIPLNFSAATAEQDQVTLHWDLPSGGYSAVGYKIFRSVSPNVDTTGSAYADVGSNVNSYVDNSGITNGTHYYYKIKAYNTFGASSATEEVGATPWLPSAVTDTANLFVNPAAAGGGNGSYNTPYNNIAAAYAAVSSGGTINLFDGSYVFTSGLTITKPITLRSLTGHYNFSNAILSGPTAGAAISLGTGSDNTVIEGLEITNFNGSSIRSTQTNSGITIRFNWIHNTTGVGIETAAGISNQNWKITKNRIENITGGSISGMYLSNADNFAVVGNYIDTTLYGGILTGGYFTNSTISENTVKNVPQQGIQAGPGFGSSTISKNIVSNANTVLTADKGCIRLYAATFTGIVYITGNEMNNCYNGLAVTNSSNDLTGKDIRISNNNIINNSNKGIHYSGSLPLDAKNNYWGNASGPQHSTNPSGIGQIADPNVTVLPFATSSFVP